MWASLHVTLTSDQHDAAENNAQFAYQELSQMAIENPYEAPEAEAPVATEPNPMQSGSANVLRPGVMPVLGVLWNAPIIVFFGLVFTGRLSNDDLPKFILILSGTIPVASLVVAFVPAIQRLLFVPDSDTKAIRSKLLSSAAMWTLLTFVGWWFAT
jgi:hypothetical protein